jgi:hypothetical protein
MHDNTSATGRTTKSVRHLEQKNNPHDRHRHYVAEVDSATRSGLRYRYFVSLGIDLDLPCFFLCRRQLSMRA